MIRTSAALLMLVALLAACGSGGGGNSNTPPTTNAGPLTPVAYRTQVNSLCTKAKQELGTTSASSAASSQASATAALEKALGIFQPILSTMQGLKPPASLATGNTKLVASLKALVDGGQALAAKLKSGTPIATALNSAELTSLTTAFTGMKTGFTTLGLTTCTNLIGG